MTNAEKFQKVFGYYATEMWAKPEKEFLEWINEEALEQEKTLKNLKKPNKSDLISRKDVIDGLEYKKEMLNRALDNLDLFVQMSANFKWGIRLIECFIEDIKELPYKKYDHSKSVTTVKWIPVNERLPEENGKYIVSLEDAVDTSARFFNGKWFMSSIDSIAREYGEYEVFAWMPPPEPYVEIAPKVPSVQPKRPTGHWKYGKWCSNCGEGITTDVCSGGVEKEEVYFCIRCGADMRGDEE